MTRPPPPTKDPLHLPELGFGAAAIARREIGARTAHDCVGRAWDLGIRYFDTAPMYGSGVSERRLGEALAHHPRSQYVLSTKVGRLVRPGHPDSRGTGRDWVFDFGADAVRTSVRESLHRLGTRHIDLLYLHDPDDHWHEAVTAAWPALAELRDQGLVRAVGVGMNQAAMLTEFVQHATPDVVLMAGQYSLLDTTALDELLPACLRRGVRVVVAQALHGGLIDGVPDASFHYRPVDSATRDTARRIAEVCHGHGVPTAAAAIQFPLGHPAVTTVLTGPRTPGQTRQNAALMRRPLPPELWHDLTTAGLLREDAPIPATSGTLPAPQEDHPR
ncbi:aldo/keto reductase [Streptomyces sp. NPDC088387]|uniref:aldo/keto reductase n=1 Tax=Streptomyces sp. NPDC088387 TaxID=3365859 RepID=UPI00380B5C6C